MLTFERQRALARANEGVSTQWVRIPVACKACGLGKTRFYELINEARGKIRTILLKSPGAQRGARLIHLPSLFAYLENLAICQEERS
jgi:hypothetical protein